MNRIDTSEFSPYRLIFISFWALICAFGIAYGQPVFSIFLACLPFGFLCFHLDKRSYPVIFLASKMLLDSVPSFSYRQFAGGMTLIDIISILMILFLGFHLLIKRTVVVDSITLSTFFLILCNLATIFYHKNFIESFDVISKWIFFLVIYNFMYVNASNAVQRKILFWLSIISIYVILNQFFSILTGSGGMHFGSMRYSGTYVHPKIVGEYLLFTIPAILYLTNSKNVHSIKTFLLLHLAAIHVCLFFAGYRTLWISLSLFWVSYILFVSKHKMPAFSLVIGLSVMVLAYPPISNILWEKFESLRYVIGGEVDVLSSTHTYDDLLSGRIGIWRVSLNDFASAEAAEKFLGLGIGYTAKKTTFYMHNEYFSALVETGALGALALSIWILSTIWKCINAKHSTHGLNFLVLSTFIPLLVLGFGTMPFRSVNLMCYMAIYLSLLSRNRFLESPLNASSRR